MAGPGKALPKEQDLGVDWRTPGGLSAREAELIRDWYSTNHGEGDLSVVQFVGFWLQHGSEPMKRWRRMAESSMSDGFSAPSVPVSLFLHTYAVLGWQDGALYETISALKWGVSRTQVLEILGLAFIHAGPMGIGNIAPGCDRIIREWDGKADEVARIWPEGWATDAQAFRAGLDFSQSGMTGAEVAVLADWYRDHQGEVPSYVGFLAATKPELLKAFRQRYESTIGEMPKQLVPLLIFHTAAMLGKAGAMRRAAYQARKYGVRRSEIICTASLAALYAGDLGMEAIADVLSPLLADWAD